jgi:hypothetical protein
MRRPATGAIGHSVRVKAAGVHNGSVAHYAGEHFMPLRELGRSMPSQPVP